MDSRLRGNDKSAGMTDAGMTMLFLLTLHTKHRASLS
jgi:hypothetical protein